MAWDVDEATLSFVLPDVQSSAHPGEGILAGWPVWRCGAAFPESLTAALMAMGAQEAQPSPPDMASSHGILVVGPDAQHIPETPHGVLRIGWGTHPPTSVHVALTGDESPVTVVQRCGAAVRRLEEHGAAPGQGLRDAE